MSIYQNDEGFILPDINKAEVELSNFKEEIDQFNSERHRSTPDLTFNKCRQCYIYKFFMQYNFVFFDNFC